MAEYSHTGILTALLLFTAVTVRDIYLGRTTTEQLEQQEQQAAKSSVASNGFPEPESNTERQSKLKFYTGPVLKFQYWLEHSITSGSLLSVCYIIFKSVTLSFKRNGP